MRTATLSQREREEIMDEVQKVTNHYSLLRQELLKYAVPKYRISFEGIEPIYDEKVTEFLRKIDRWEMEAIRGIEERTGISLVPKQLENQ